MVPLPRNAANYKIYVQKRSKTRRQHCQYTVGVQRGNKDIKTSASDVPAFLNSGGFLPCYKNHRRPLLV